MNPFKNKIDEISEEETFKSFFMHYFPRLKGFIGGLLQDSEEAEDITQDIFVTLWKNRQMLGSIDNLDAYLFRIAKNAVYRFVERSLLLKNYQQRTESNGQLVTDDVEELLQAHETELLIGMTVENMPPQRKAIFKMSREKGMSNDEISSSLKISKRTVENHLTQALADIRKALLSIMFTTF